MIKLNFEHTLDLTAHAVKQNVPVLLTGKSGIGKTALIEEMCRENGWDMRAFALSTKERTDIVGLLSVNDEGRTQYHPTAIVPLITDDLKRPCVIFFDEIQAGDPSTQKSVYSILQERRIDTYQIHPFVRFVAARNTYSDGGFDEDLPAPLLNRMMHINVEPDTNNFLAYASNKGLSATIRAFLAMMPEAIHKFDPDTIESDPAFPSPRAWENLSTLFMHKPVKYSEKVKALVQATVGNTIGSTFLTFVREAPPFTVKQAINDPELILTTDMSVSARWILATALIDSATNDNAGKVIQCLENFKRPELIAVTISQLLSKKSLDFSSLLANKTVMEVVNQNTKWIKKTL